jgi:hypothetical protein
MGGEPGSNFGDYGWHPCFFCGASGLVTVAQMVAYEESELACQADEAFGYRPEWDEDSTSHPDEPFAPSSPWDEAYSLNLDEIPF